MAYIHSKGIAHLDLKTSNILLSGDRKSTVVADFGISQTCVGAGSVASMNPAFDTGGGVEMGSFGSALGSTGSLALTPHYCAPERLLRKDLTFAELLATDVYTYGSQRGVCHVLLRQLVCYFLL